MSLAIIIQGTIYISINKVHSMKLYMIPLVASRLYVLYFEKHTTAEYLDINTNSVHMKNIFLESLNYDKISKEHVLIHSDPTQLAFAIKKEN